MEEKLVQAVDAIAEKLKETYPPRPFSYDGNGRKLSENSNGNGQYQAIRVEVDAVKEQLDDFKSSINARFSDLSNEIGKIGTNLSNFIQNQGKASGESFYKIAGIIAGAVGISLTIIGAFGSLAKVNLDTNIVYTNDKITETNKTIDKLTAAVGKVVDTTIPRPELEYRINSNRDNIRDKADTTLVNEIVRRLEESNRSLMREADGLAQQISDGRRETATKAELASLNERFSVLSTRLNDFQSKFTAVPAIPALTGVNPNTQLQLPPQR